MFLPNFMQTLEYILGDLGHKIGEGKKKKEWDLGFVRNSAVGVGKGFVLFLCTPLSGWSLILFSWFFVFVFFLCNIDSC